MADAYYEPGRFTTFTAFEFTASDRATGGWLHRNVFFRGEQIPEWGGASILLEHSPERLWEWLDEACTGACQVLAIPHNTNYGMGVALAPRNSDGTPFTEDVLRRRARLEPVIEMHQVKGNSECATGLLSTDEECNFELLFEPCEPGRDLAASSQPAPNCAHPSNFARNALKTGLEVEAEHGINPFKYGLIGSTTITAARRGRLTKRPGRATSSARSARRLRLGRATTPAGWPPSGRKRIRARRSSTPSAAATFATSGPRIRVRFFAGWDFPADLHASPTLLETAYRDGVPMGADLPAVPAAGAAPAVRRLGHAGRRRRQPPEDSGRQGLGRRRRGNPRAGARRGLRRRPRAGPGTGRCADNGAQVNLADCSYSANLGAAELSATWTDPGVRPGPAGVLLRPRPRKPYLPVDHLAGAGDRRRAAGRRAAGDQGTGVELAHLVYAGWQLRRRSHAETPLTMDGPHAAGCPLAAADRHRRAGGGLRGVRTRDARG